MPHQREVIRKKVRDVLIAAATSAGSRVYATRVLSLRGVELPAIAVYTLDEDSAPDESAPRELKREIPVRIEGYVKAVPDVVGGLTVVDDTMDALALQIETAMHADPFLASEVGDKGATLVSTECEVIQDGDRLIGLVALTYATTYFTLAPAAPTALDDFERVDAKHTLSPPVHPGNTAEDTFTVEQP